MRLYSFAFHIVRYLVVRGLYLFKRANGSVAKANGQPRSCALWCDKVASLHASLQLTMGLEVLNFHLNPSFFLCAADSIGTHANQRTYMTRLLNSKLMQHITTSTSSSKTVHHWTLVLDEFALLDTIVQVYPSNR